MLRSALLYTALFRCKRRRRDPPDWQAARAGGMDKLVVAETPAPGQRHRLHRPRRRRDDSLSDSRARWSC